MSQKAGGAATSGKKLSAAPGTPRDSNNGPVGRPRSEATAVTPKSSGSGKNRNPNWSEGKKNPNQTPRSAPPKVISDKSARKQKQKLHKKHGKEPKQSAGSIAGTLRKEVDEARDEVPISENAVSNPMEEMEWERSAGTSDQAQPEWTITTRGGGAFDVKRMAFSKDSRYFAIPVGTKVKIYSVHTSKVIRVLEYPQREGEPGRKSPKVKALQWHPTESSQIYVAYKDGTIRLWAILSGTVRKEWTLPHGIIHFRLDVGNPSNAFIICDTSTKSSKTNHTLYTLDFQTGTSTRTRHAFQRPTIALEVSQDRDWLVVADETMFAVVYLGDRSKGVGDMRIYYPDEDIQSIAIHPTDGYVAVGEKGGKITSWYCLALDDRSLNKPVRTAVHWHADQVNAVTFSSDGTYMLSGGEESVLVIWQLDTKFKDYLPRLGWKIESLAVSPNQQLYAIGLGNNSVLIVGASNLKVRMTVAGIMSANIATTPTPKTLPYIPHLSSIILPATPGSLQFYSPQTDTHIQTLQTTTTNLTLRSAHVELPQPLVTHTAISPSGAWMVTVEKRERANVGDVEFKEESWLKFWRWSDEDGGFVMNTRVEGPHLGGVTGCVFSRGEVEVEGVGRGLQIALQESQRTLATQEQSYASQLELLKMRGALKEDEVKKLGELNAELFGHANQKQKIRHVADLKEENLNLKKENMTLSRQRDEARRKVMNLEREIESVRALPPPPTPSALQNNPNASFSERSFSASSRDTIGGNGLPGTVKKQPLSRVGRAALAARENGTPGGMVGRAGRVEVGAFGRERREDRLGKKEEDGGGEDRENGVRERDVRERGGGVSFVVDV
ncbi:hypothetical protein HDV00_006888 [Rhizophlyctis rosea]|nr:hypothetical protein HDV00_006888 [Rhizophlyctis rosea]